MQTNINENEINMLRTELELLMRERLSLLKVTGAAAGLIAEMDLQSLSGDRATAGGLTLGLENAVAPASIDRGASMRTRLCIRPAAVAVGAEADGQSNLCRGTIVQVEFLGDTVRIRLAPDGAPGLLIQADTPRLRLDRLPIVGESIAFALPPRHLRLLPDDE